MRTFVKDDSKVKSFCVEVVSKDGRKFNFVIRDQMQCENVKRSLKLQAFQDKDKPEDTASAFRLTFAAEYYNAIIRDKTNQHSSTSDRKLIEALNKQAWQTYGDPLLEFKR